MPLLKRDGRLSAGEPLRPAGNIINDGSAFGEISSSLISESDAPDSYRTDENGRIVAAVYNRTVYAQWRSIFDGGYGSAASPFVISDAADLYVLEATRKRYRY